MAIFIKGEMSLENLRFRAWDKEEKEWLSIRTIGFNDDGSLWYLQAWDDNENDIDPPYFEDDLGVKWELLQSTGLKDKNGIEIFEGDIIEEPYSSSPFRNSTLRSIEMYQGVWVARDIKEPVLGEISVSLSILRGSKVIGNIYENKDLK